MPVLKHCSSQQKGRDRQPVRRPPLGVAFRPRTRRSGRRCRARHSTHDRLEKVPKAMVEGLGQPRDQPHRNRRSRSRSSRPWRARPSSNSPSTTSSSTTRDGTAIPSRRTQRFTTFINVQPQRRVLDGAGGRGRDGPGSSIINISSVLGPITTAGLRRPPTPRARARLISLTRDLARGRHRRAESRINTIAAALRVGDERAVPARLPSTPQLPRGARGAAGGRARLAATVPCSLAGAAHRLGADAASKREG